MVPVSSFVQLGSTFLCFFCVLFFRSIASLFYSDMIGEMVAGVLLGPFGANLIPYPSALIWVGQLALILLIIEAGVHFELHSICNSGVRVFMAATTGVILPLLVCPGFLWLFGGSWLESLSGSACLASTSIGFAVTLLQKYGMLESSLGQIISGAAMLDDIESLVLLGLLSSFHSDSFSHTLITICIPIISSISLLIVGLLLSWGMPEVISFLLEKTFSIRKRYVTWRNPENDREIDSIEKLPEELMVVVILFFSSFFILLAIQSKTTYLLGSFVGGISFSQVKNSRKSFEKLSQVIQVMMSVFFFSIGFYVPITLIFEWKLFLLGLLFTLPAIIVKLAVGLFESTWNRRLILGFAMVGRGEVGFMMASSALQNNVISERIFIIVIWALALSTSFAPFPFQYFVKKNTEER